MSGDPVDLTEVINSLDLFTPWDAVCEAIRCGNENIVRASGAHLTHKNTLAPKKEAIAISQLDFLEILLQHDGLIDEHVVLRAAERKDRNALRLLLDYGWLIDRPLGLVGPLLW